MEHQKLQGLMTDAERMARVASAGLRAAQAKQTAPSGAISLDNADGTRTIIGEVVNGEDNPSYTMATHVGDTTPPGVPTGITATSKSGVVVVEWDGTLDGGIPDDFFCVRVYLDGTELGALTEAGSVASAKLDGGTTVSITATSEDDCCLPDGTPDHNVSQASQAISITVTSSAAEIIVDVEEEIEGVQQEITDFKREVAADYYKSEYIDDNFSTVEEVGAVYRDSMARNLSPFYAHDFTDVYDAENPEGYWNALTTALTEQLSDGWAHVTLDNSAGTGAMYAYATVRAAFLPIVAGTLMVELRNVQVTASGRWGIGRTPQGLTYPYLDVTEGGTYYRPCTVNDPTSAVALELRFYAFAGVSVEFDARLSYYEGEYDGKYKQYNADTANLTREYATKTWTKQTAEDYSIGAAQKYTATIANPNITPFYAHDLADVYNATTNPNGYWIETPLRATQLEDGWAHITLDNTSGSGTMYSRTYVRPMASVPDKATLMIEIRNLVTNVTSLTDPPRLWFNASASNSQMWRDVVFFKEDGTYRYTLVKTNNANPTHFARWWWGIEAGGTAEFDARISIYENATDSEGETIPYAGNFKPYVTDQAALSKEYATQSQLKVGLDGITAEVSETYATKGAGNPNLTPLTAHDLTDRYNATTNPGGYWRADLSWAENISDGWAHVELEPATGTRWGQQFQTVLLPDLKPSTKYTLLMEYRNVSVTGTLTAWPLYASTDQFVYPPETTSFTVDRDMVVRAQLVTKDSFDGITGGVDARHRLVAPSGGDGSCSYDLRLSLYENASGPEGESLPYEGTYKPYVTDQQALGTTYTAKTTFEQTTQGFDSRISQNADNIAGEVLARETLIRQYANGVLVCKVGESVGALVNASGSFDVVAVSWSGNTPTVGGELAKFGQESQIGQESGTFLGIDSRSMRLTDGASSQTYFEAADLRGDDGVATLTSTYIADGITATQAYEIFILPLESIEEVTGVTLDGTATTRFYVQNLNEVVVENTTKGQTVAITYTTESVLAKAYTLGIRRGGGDVGAMSVAEGIYTMAQGAMAHAEGSWTQANGEASHAGGESTTANGPRSFAHGTDVVADYDSQIVVGKYNARGLNSLFEVGTGDPTMRESGFWVGEDGATRIGTYGTAIAGVFFGSKVVDPAGAAYATLFTSTEAVTEFGQAPNAARDIVVLTNGDPNAYQGQMTAALTGGNIRAYFSPTKNGNIRVNYLVIIGA